MSEVLEKMANEPANRDGTMTKVSTTATTEAEKSEEFTAASKKVWDALVKKGVGEDGLSQEEAEKFADEQLKAALELIEAKANFDPREFDYDFLELFFDEPFLSSVSMGITKHADFSVKTAYMGARRSGKGFEIVMGYNPDFFRSLSKIERRGVIMHELYHLIFQHIFSRAPGDKHYQELWNWATDMAINSIIGEDKLPDACLIPGRHPLDPKTGKPIEGPYGEYIANAKKMECSDHYFEELRRIEEEQNDGGQSIEVAMEGGMGSLDDHGAWDNIPKEIQEQVKNAMRGILEDAAKKAQRTNSWGNVPSEIQEIINKLISHEIDWRSILRQFIGRCRTMDRDSTIKRINKKVPYKFPGYVRKYIASFACFIDQSGSMSDNDISMLFSELEGLASQTEIEVFHFDTEIDEKSRTTWKKGRPFPPAHRTRCGGTDFQAVADFCNKPENRGKWSGIVILTDGYAPKMGQILGSKTIWVITEGGDMNAVRSGDLAIQMKSDTKQFKRY